MILKTSSFQTSDSQIFSTIALAQGHEIKLLLIGHSSTGSLAGNDAERIAEVIVENSEAVLDILSTKPSSRPRARKINKPKKILKQQPESTGMP